MRLVAILIICICVFYVGVLFGKFYKIKLQIFYDLMQLCELLELQIKFKKEVIAKIIEDNRTMFSNEFNKIIDCYYYKKNDSVNISVLSNKEQMLIKNFFNSLGRADVEGEINNIKSNFAQFSIVYNDVKIKSESTGALGPRLGLRCAIIVFIVCI